MKEIFKTIDGYKDYIIELQTGLISIPAISPDLDGEGEYDKAMYIEKELKKLKFDEIIRMDAPHKQAKNGVRPNIAAKIYGKDKSRTLWILSHIDIVPAGDVKLWNSDPFKIQVAGDKIYGRGAEDNNQGIISSLLAVRAFMDLGVRPDINIGLMFCADEELGSKYGIQYVLKRYANLFKKQDFFAVPDYPDKTGTLIEVAEKHMLWLKFEVVGKGGHSATPHLNNNAFRAGSKLVTALDALYKEFNKKDKLFDLPYSSFEPTKKDANVPNINAVPGADVFYMDCRVLPSYKTAQVVAEAKKIAAKIAKENKVKVTVEVMKDASSTPTSPKAYVVKLFQDAIKDVRKKPSKLAGVGGGTVAAPIRNAGMDAVVIGFSAATLHGPNEYARISNIISDAKVFAHTIKHAR